MPLSPTNRLPSGMGKRNGVVDALSASKSSQLKTRPGDRNSLPAGRIAPKPARPPAAAAAPAAGGPPAAPTPRPPARSWNTGRVAEPFSFANARDLGILLEAVVPEHLQRRHVPVRGRTVADQRPLCEHQRADA